MKLAALTRTVLISGIATLLTLTSLLAQERVGQERQISFHRTASLFVVTADLNRQYDLIGGVPTLVEARLFTLADTAFVLDLILTEAGSRVRRRQDLDSAKAEQIIDRVTAALPDYGVDQPYTSELDQSGRGALLWGSTLWGLFYYGAASSYAITGEANSAWPFLIAGGVGYLLPAILTNNAPVSDGAASLALGGMFQGILHGWAMAFLIQGSDVGDSDRLGSALSVVGGITEAVVGYAVATNTGMTDGRAGAINTTSFYGLVIGGLTSAVIFDVADFNSDAAVRIAGGAGLVGATAGIFVGDALAHDQRFSSGDATVYAISGALGLTLPYSILATIQPDNISPSLVSGIGIVGTVGGLWLGTELIRGLDYKAADGTIMTLSTIGGGLIGLGAAIAIEDATAAAILPWTGAAAGFALSLALAKPGSEPPSMGSLDFDVNPMAPWTLRTSADGITRPAPFATLRYRF